MNSMTLALLAFFMAGSAAASTDGMSTEPEETSALRCRLEMPARVVSGQPALLRMILRNDGPQRAQVLVWGTPFEGQWFAPFVGVVRGGTELVYGGAMVKRGDPSLANYVVIESSQSGRAEIDLALAYDLKAPGHYRVMPRVTLYDVVVGPGTVPRPRAELRSQNVACNAPVFEVTR